MTPEQAQKLLDKLQEVKSEQLEGEARKLFEAIMKIADERDSLKIKVVNQQERIDYLMRSIERKEQSLIEEHEENIEYYTKIEEKDKIIDEMAKTINEAYYASGDFEEWFENKICKIQRYEDYTYLEKDIKQYFENKVKEK